MASTTGHEEDKSKTSTNGAVPQPPDHRIPMTTAQALDQPNQSERTFGLFPKLPPELRNKIWKLSLPGPRVIRITHDPRNMATVKIQEIGAGPSPFWRAKANAGPVPALLHVNKEARSLASQYYSLAFEKQTQGRPVYFDAPRDTLHLPNREGIRAFYGRLHPEHCIQKTAKDLEHMLDTEKSVLNLAICSIQWGQGPSPARILPRYPNLAHLALCACHSRFNWHSERRFEKLWTDTGKTIPKITFMGRKSVCQRCFDQED